MLFSLCCKGCVNYDEVVDAVEEHPCDECKRLYVGENSNLKDLYTPKFSACLHKKKGEKMICKQYNTSGACSLSKTGECCHYSYEAFYRMTSFGVDAWCKLAKRWIKNLSSCPLVQKNKGGHK